MLFYEVQLCVQQPSSCCSNVLCCSGNLREARGMKDTVSAFHLPFNFWDIMECWTEQGQIWLFIRLVGGLEGQNCSCVLGF